MMIDVGHEARPAVADNDVTRELRVCPIIMIILCKTNLISFLFLVSGPYDLGLGSKLGYIT